MKQSPQQRAMLRCCGSCEWIYSGHTDCPKCGWASYGARFVHGAKAYRYKFTQEPWRRKMKWEPIETAPKDGTEVVLWCEKRKVLLHECSFISGKWHTYGLNPFDTMTWVALEPYEVPTHWLQIIPPERGES